MIFAAGLGSRLKPITDTRPKALVTVGGKTMLEHIILKLKAAGFDEIVINVHRYRAGDFPIRFLLFWKLTRTLESTYKSRTKQTACLIPAAVWKKHTIYYTILRICLPKKAKPRMN